MTDREEAAPMTADPPECDVNGWCDLPGGHRGECRSASDQTIEGPGVVPSDDGETPVTTRPAPTLARLRALEAAATQMARDPWHGKTARDRLAAAAVDALPALLAVVEAARDVLGWFDGHDGPDVGRAVEARLRAALRALEDQP